MKACQCPPLVAKLQESALHATAQIQAAELEPTPAEVAQSKAAAQQVSPPTVRKSDSNTKIVRNSAANQTQPNKKQPLQAANKPPSNDQN